MARLAGGRFRAKYHRTPLPTANSNPYGITTGPDGALWFTEENGNKIGRITTAGVITEFPTPTVNSAPAGITMGPDGALWFTEASGNNIGKITAAGVITEFPIPTANSNAIGITTGSDGALWFTEGGANLAIGRITTTGVIKITEFPIPNIRFSAPQAITAGPDGAIWFSLIGTDFNRIERITTAGAFTPYPPSTPVSSTSITTGSDGALWFTNAGNGGSIGRITTEGVYSEFPIPGNHASTHITAGPDGALWFTEGSSNNIGRITTAGVITEFPIPTANSNPIGITTGPDGALWFTEAAGNKIGRLCPSGLHVLPTSNIFTSGFRGGPFDPSSFPYKLTDCNNPNFSFTIAGVPSWLNFNLDLTTTPYMVTFSVNANANALVRGVHGPANIVVVDLTDAGSPNQTRSATISVFGAVSHDFNGDGHGDLIWRDASGNTGVWLMNAGTILSSAGIGTVPTSWSIVGQRDFDGDGKTDLLWRDSSGNTAIWFMSGTQVASSVGVGNIPTIWNVVGTGDFNGDGMGDILWRDSTGNLGAMADERRDPLDTGGSRQRAHQLERRRHGRLQRRRKTDLLWRDNLGNTAMWFMNGTRIASTGALGTIPTTGRSSAPVISIPTAWPTSCGATPPATLQSG